MTKKNDTSNVRRVVVKKQVNLGDTVKILGTNHLYNGKVGLVVERITRLDDCNVQAWMVDFGKVKDIFWDDELIK